MSIFLGIVIGILYYFFICKLCEIVIPPDINTIILLLIGLCGIFIAYKLIKNKTFKYGLYGASALMFYDIFSKWTDINNSAKLVIILVFLLGFVIYVYKNISPYKRKNINNIYGKKQKTKHKPKFRTNNDGIQ